jgi:hypothetical protein
MILFHTTKSLFSASLAEQNCLAGASKVSTFVSRNLNETNQTNKKT